MNNSPTPLNTLVMKHATVPSSDFLPISFVLTQGHRKREVASHPPCQRGGILTDLPKMVPIMAALKSPMVRKNSEQHAIKGGNK